MGRAERLSWARLNVEVLHDFRKHYIGVSDRYSADEWPCCTTQVRLSSELEGVQVAARTWKILYLYIIEIYYKIVGHTLWKFPLPSICVYLCCDFHYILMKE